MATTHKMQSLRGVSEVYMLVGGTSVTSKEKGARNAVIADTNIPKRVAEKTYRVVVVVVTVVLKNRVLIVPIKQKIE